ncbi:MAG: DUF3459 domain-containing protein, partial [Terriglobales bacterium]
AETFEASRLNWDAIAQPQHREWLRLYRQLLQLRRQHIVSRLSNKAEACAIKAHCNTHADHGLTAEWHFPNRSKLTLIANLGVSPLSGLTPPVSNMIYASEEVNTGTLQRGTLPPWSVAWFLEP